MASDISNKYILIVFDELEILDIADAMIVSKLFNRLLDKRVLFIITSNYYPDELYKNGLQRSQFLPFIDLIKESLKEFLRKETLLKEFILTLVFLILLNSKVISLIRKMVQL